MRDQPIERRRHNGGLDRRQCGDQGCDGYDDGGHVEEEERIESCAEEIEAVVVRRIDGDAEPQENAGCAAAFRACTPEREERHGNSERDPVVAVPGCTDPLDVSVLRLERQPERRLDGHQRH
jgi:hypothetical protein